LRVCGTPRAPLADFIGVARFEPREAERAISGSDQPRDLQAEVGEDLANLAVLASVRLISIQQFLPVRRSRLALIEP
jgi:hypothetical protein